MKIVLIRHFMTKGNVERRYIGTTDEPLDKDHLPDISKFLYPEVECVITSTMLRCNETARHLYPAHEPISIEALKECDFGAFEYKNHMELSKDPKYQKWIDGKGSLPFPEGESQGEFQKRCVDGFEKIIEHLIKEHIKSVAFVIHGGTIMAIMNAFGYPIKGFFERQVENGHGFLVNIEEELWKQGKQIVEEEYYI